MTVTSAPIPLARCRDSLAAKAVAHDDEPLAGEEDVRGADDAVDRRLARAVAVVEQMLRVGVVDGDYRVAEYLGRLHGPEADDTGPCVLGAADHLRQLVRTNLVEPGDQVAPVVHGQLRMPVEHRVDVAVVALVALASEGEGGNPLVLDKGRGHVVLGRKGVRGAREHRGAAGLQGLEEVRRLGGHVQAHPDHESGERALALEALPYRAQHGHLRVGPGDPQPAEASEAPVRDVSVFSWARHPGA